MWSKTGVCAAAGVTPHAAPSTSAEDTAPTMKLCSVAIVMAPSVVEPPQIGAVDRRGRGQSGICTIQRTRTVLDSPCGAVEGLTGRAELEHRTGLQRPEHAGGRGARGPELGRAAGVRRGQAVEPGRASGLLALERHEQFPTPAHADAAELDRRTVRLSTARRNSAGVAVAREAHAD